MKHNIRNLSLKRRFSPWIRLCSVSASGYGSVGSVCFWASWIRIRIRNLFVRIRILPSTSKKINNLDFLLFCDFFMTYYLRNMVWMYLQKWVSIKTWRKIIIFCCHLEGHRRKEQDPDPHPDPLAEGMAPSEDPDPHPDPYQFMKNVHINSVLAG